jgi:hypothetical protein
MRRSAAFTLWRRHSFLINTIITSHLTKWTNQVARLDAGQRSGRVSIVPPDVRVLPLRSMCRYPDVAGADGKLARINGQSEPIPLASASERCRKRRPFTPELARRAHLVRMVQ